MRVKHGILQTQQLLLYKVQLCSDVCYVLSQFHEVQESNAILILLVSFTQSPSFSEYIDSDDNLKKIIFDDTDDKNG